MAAFAGLVSHLLLTGAGPLLAAPPRATRQDALAMLEDDATRALRSEALPFSRRAALVERLDAARAGAADRERRARLSLLWLRGVRWLLASIPIEDGGRSLPYRAWLERHEHLVIYSEPAGQWLIVPNLIWQVHDLTRSTTAADDIAWVAVENGLPGECEGYVPCYAHGLHVLSGEYLRRHPRGQHADEALQRIREGLEQAWDLHAGPGGTDFFNPSTDCVDLRPPLEALRAAVKGAVHDARFSALAPIDRLLSLCP